MTQREAGILLPVTSLPSDYGIGCFSKEAYDFADWLERAGQSFWQILPIGPVGYGDSPYQSFSSYAGNPYLISLDELIAEGTLSRSECSELSEGDIDYEKLFNTRYKILRLAYSRNCPEHDRSYREFTEENKWWLDDYALFMAIKEYFGGTEWSRWDSDIKTREKNAVERYSSMLEDDIKFHKYMQYKFFSQWKRLKSYISEKGIKIIGDIPIYVSYDSADVWANPGIFQLDESLLPKAVAGCPPDGFSPEGQLWGNPLYDWEAHKKDGYRWWIKRFGYSFGLFDVVRIDHFRGFDEYYSIPYGAKNAVDGVWRAGPGAELFKAVEDALGKPEFIAEDLGFMTDSVKELLKSCGFPGMRVLEFAFDERDTGSAGDYLPHNYIYNCTAYTGTHDNQTVNAWFAELSEKEKLSVRKYLCDFYTPDDKMNIPLIGVIMRSAARLCIVPLQDYMGLGEKARINRPSTLGCNWRWRLKKGEADEELCRLVSDMTVRCGRGRNKAQG